MVLKLMCFACGRRGKIVHTVIGQFLASFITFKTPPTLRKDYVIMYDT